MSIFSKDHFFILNIFLGDCSQIKRRTYRYCDSGVWLGLYGTYCRPCQYGPIRPSSQVWRAQHWGPDHLYQRGQYGGPTTVNMSNLYKGNLYSFFCFIIVFL